MLICWTKHEYHKEKSMEVLLDARREVGLEVNKEKTKYMVVSCHQKAEKNYNLLVANKFCKNVAKF
jgi:hypothetical protein